MKISKKELGRIAQIDKAIIHSLDMSLYQLYVVVGGVEHVVFDNGQYLRSHSKLELQRWLSQFSVRQVVLRHSSAYDEMVGHPVNTNGNVLEVPLGGADLEGPDSAMN